MAWNVVILGGGFGGFYTARKLERTLPPASARVTRDQRRQLHALHPAAAWRRRRHARAPPRRRAAARAAQEQPPEARARSAGGSVAQAGDDPLPRGPRGDARLRPARGHARLHLAHAADPRAEGARARLQDAVRGDRPAQPARAHARARGVDRRRRGAPLAAHLRLRGRRLRRGRGPRRAPGLRRRRARALPALPHARPALRARRGARPPDARDLRGAGELRGRRAAPPRDRDPPRHDDRAGLSRLDRALHGRGDPHPHGRLDGGRQAAPDRRRAGPPARRWRPHQGRRVLPGRGLRRRVGDRRRRRGARPGAAGPAVPADVPARDPAGPHGRRERRGGARRMGTASRSSYKTLGVFVDMGRHQAVAETLGIRWRGFPAWFLARTYHLA